MRKVAIIGAGSIVFCKTLMLDIMATEGLEDTEFALMAPSTRNTSKVEEFINKVIQENGLDVLFPTIKNPLEWTSPEDA